MRRREQERMSRLGWAVVGGAAGAAMPVAVAAQERVHEWGGAISAAGGQGPLLSAGGIALILLWAVLFLAASAAIGHVLSGDPGALLARLGHPERLLVVGVSVCFTLAFVAEAIGLAAIVGAFATRGSQLSSSSTS